MRFEVHWTPAAAAELQEITDWIAERDSPAKSEYVTDRIEAAVNALKTYPNRGPCPSELAEIGLTEFRETLFKPYRIIYRVQGGRVHIYVVADGRRDMRTLLARRLLAI